MTFTRARVAFATSLVVVGAAGASTIGSTATAGSTLCPSAKTCIYMDANFVGLLGYRAAGGGIQNVSSGANDKMTSWENKTRTNGAWYKDSNGSGGCHNLVAGQQQAHSNGYNDQLSSWRTDRAC